MTFPQRPPTSRALAWVILAAFLHFASLYYLAPTLPLYVVDLGGSTWEVGLIVGVFAVASLLARPFLGAWMDRAGRKPFLIAGAGIYVAASLGYLVIRSVPGLLWWRVFHALGLATFSTAAASMVGDLAKPRRRGSTMGMFGLAQAGALTVGPSVGGGVQAALGYPGLFVATACTALAALGCAIAVPEDRSAGLHRPPDKLLARGRGLMAATCGPAVAQVAASVAYGAIIAFVAVFARERGLDAVGAFFALLALSSLGIRLAAGTLYDSWGASGILAPAFLAVASGLILLVVAMDARVFLLSAILIGLGVGATHTTLLARVVDQAGPTTRGRSVATFTACWELGVGVGTVLTGKIAEMAGFPAMFLAVASLSLVGLGSLPWLRRQSRLPAS